MQKFIAQEGEIDNFAHWYLGAPAVRVSPARVLPGGTFEDGVDIVTPLVKHGAHGRDQVLATLPILLAGTCESSSTSYSAWFIASSGVDLCRHRTTYTGDIPALVF